MSNGKVFGRLFLLWTATAKMVVDGTRKAGEVANYLQLVVDRADFATAKGRFPSELLAPELIPDHLKVVVDVEPSDFSLDDIEYVSVLEGLADEPQYIGGKAMLGQAIVLDANLGFVDLKGFLAEPEKIPEAFRGKKYIVFAGTVFRGSVGDRCVAYLVWDGGPWVLHFDWLGCSFYASDVLPRRKSGT